MHLVSVQSFSEALALNPCLQDQDQDQDAMVIGGTRRVPKPYYEFDLDRSGSPMLPELDGITLENKKSMVRSFLTIHYSKPDHRHPFHHLTPAGTGTCCGKPKVPVPWSDIMKGQSRFISTIYLPDDTKILEPSKLNRADANAILEFWWDRQETQVGPTFKFKAWMDHKGRMRSPVVEGESDGDADDESPTTGQRREPSATSTCSLTSIPKGRSRPTKRPYVSSAEDESDNAEAEASPLTVKPRNQGDRPVPTVLGKRARVHEDQPMASLPATHISDASHDESCSRNASHQSPQASHGDHTIGRRTTRGGMETRRGLEHLSQSPIAQQPTLRRTRAARNVSPVVQERQPKNVPAPRECLPRKTKAAGLAAGVPSDAPAKGTRSNAENSRTTRTRQKPKKYADYV